MKLLKHLYKILNIGEISMSKGVYKLLAIFILSFFVLSPELNAQYLHSNITINTTATSGGAWAGSGTDASPYIFTPTAATSNILNTELQTKLNAANGNVIINTQYTAGTTIKNSVTPFSSSITKAYSSKLSMWNQNNATVDLQVKTTEEKNGVVTNRDQQAKVFLVKEDGSWLVNSFELVK